MVKKEGRTVLYVSHNMNTIRQLCDRCIVLDKGKIIFIGDVESAINIYSNAKQLEFLQHYDLSNMERNGTVTDKFRLTGINLDKCVLSDTEKLNFDLTFESYADSNVSIRIVLANQTGPVGTTFSKIYPLTKGENIIKFEFDATVLSHGEYKASIVLNEHIEEMQIRHDSVADAFAFRVEENVPIYNLKWNREYWGDSKLPWLINKEVD